MPFIKEHLLKDTDATTKKKKRSIINKDNEYEKDSKLNKSNNNGKQRIKHRG